MRFGKLLVLELAEKSKNGTAKWRCRCDCGVEKVLFSTVLRRGQASCGCDQPQRISEARTTHGMTESATYNSWKSMRARCTNPNSPDYAAYGGRGIAYCAAWESFETFLKDMGERPEGMTLDRFPNQDGNYEPGNCRWATSKSQANNRSANVYVEYGGRSLTLSELGETIGMDRRRVRYWIAVKKLTPEQVAEKAREESLNGQAH